jgi:hypothetical protein
MMNDAEWLEGLDVGSEVVVWRHSTFSSTARLTKVERLTKTRIVVGGKHFNRKTGREVGAAYPCRLKSPVSMEKTLAETRRRDLLREISMKDIEKLSEKDLQSIIEIIRGGSVETGPEA